MSLVVPSFEHTAIVRAEKAEILGASQLQVRLLADSSATGGALSTVRVSLAKGADGAKPHTHQKSAEMFYVLDGKAQFLSGADIVKAQAGDVIVVPPGMPHAFAAERNSTADILIVIAPGVERFEYFRKLTRVARGEEAPESMQDIQGLYDNFFLNSPEWERARANESATH